MLQLFTGGIVSAQPTPAFALAVICGAGGWVALATIMRLPVSTTHAIIGSLIGAGVFFGPAAIAWNSLAPRFAAPLLLSIGISYALSAGLMLVFARRNATSADCVCVSAQVLDASAMQLQQVNVISGSTQECSTQRVYLQLNTETLHWLSSGAVGFARGLNDTPKLVAIGVVTIGASLGMQFLVVLVAVSMFMGSLYAGRRVAQSLAEKVVRMDHSEGLLANVATAILVGIGSNMGLPMSTTHVSTAAIAGIARGRLERLNMRTVYDFLLAWIVTPLVAGTFAALSYLLAARWI
jgi:PiT family inorganic phosphate transporter